MSTRQNKLLMVVVLTPVVGLFMAGWAGAGSLEPTAAPTNPASAMFTLNDIYNKLNTRAAVSMRTNAFAEPTGGPTSGTMHTLNDIMTMVTNRAPVPETGQTTSYMPGDDGWYSTNVGVAWPNPRFTVGASGDATNCVTDNLTGLMWTRDASNACGLAVAATNWGTAVTNCNNLTYGGYDDWRLPNERELKSLIHAGYFSPALCNTAGTAKWTEGNPFTGVQAAWYWSSTTYANDPGYAWHVALNDGRVPYSSKVTAYYYVWPVRGGGK